MNTEKSLARCGFISDEENLNLSEVFSDNAVYKEIYIDIYSDNIFDNTCRPMLLLRTTQEKIAVANDGTNLALVKCDKFKTHIMNIRLEEIIECYYKKTDINFEFILNCQNIYYKIAIFK